MPEQLGKVAIIGLGLIGGSVGAALKQRQAARVVCGVDSDPGTVELATELEVADEASTEPAQVVSGADLVIVAVPVQKVATVMREIAPLLTPGTVVTDVASVKGEIARQAQALLPGHVNYVGGHPMSGSEKHGIRAADPYLFENAAYVICPPESRSDDAGIREAVRKVELLAGWLGARPIQLPASLHDRLVAHVSHLPHLLASALVHAAAELKRDGAWELAAGGFRDMTRIAAADPDLWIGICSSNREALRESLLVFKQALARVESWLDGKSDIRRFLAEAKALREELPAGPGLLPQVFDLAVTIPDRPGEIGRLCVLLGKNEINIANLGIMHVREGTGGTLRLVFSTQQERDAAADVLAEAGYKVMGLV